MRTNIPGEERYELEKNAWIRAFLIVALVLLARLVERL